MEEHGKGSQVFYSQFYTLNLHAYAVSFPTRPDDTPTTLTMSEFVINNCVMNGYHAYEPVVNVRDTYKCQPEMQFPCTMPQVKSKDMFLSIYAIT